MQVQDTSTDPYVPLAVYRKLAVLRKQPSFQRGAMAYGLVNKDVITFIRYSRGSPPFLVVVNFGHNSVAEDLSTVLDGVSYIYGVVVQSALPLENDTAGKVVHLTEVKLDPAQALVFELKQSQID